MDGSEEGGRELSFSPIQHEFGISHPFFHEEDSAHQASFLAPFWEKLAIGDSLCPDHCVFYHRCHN